MGQHVRSDAGTRADHERHRHKLRRGLAALRRMLDEGGFAAAPPTMGLEIEFSLVDAEHRPAMLNRVVLEKLDDPRFTTELGQHNLELNVPPRPLTGDEPLGLERELVESLAEAAGRAEDTGAALVMIGSLPTLRVEHFDARWLTADPRYRQLNDRIIAARGEDLRLAMEGIALPGRVSESLRSLHDSILTESACTSTQLHRMVSPAEFAPFWNAAQCLAGVQVAIGANSPFLLRKALWHETRIPLFLQATDTRPDELKNQGVRPRVWFGERWISSIADLFEENCRYFPGLLAELDDEDPLDALDAGHIPRLSELRLHNGTIWRWNRPVYDIACSGPHLRVENRVLPSGPTVVDLVANAVFFYGAQHALTLQEPPVWTMMSFQAAEENLHAGARHGFAARLYWPGDGRVAPADLVLRRLLPLAELGLRDLGVSAEARDRYLGVIESRCLARRTGASWQRDAVAALETRGHTRDQALTGMLARYMEHSATGAPVHSWPDPA
ncbi:glutamate--cysteine ligase [Actinokineospora sp. G85]|uniref:glutamate--cysteine ligase n=1 Tax=Actinokineospora sp. G85 TaxID=3406626 RepID=UPI003C7476F8